MSVISEYINDLRFIFKYRRDVMTGQKELDKRAPRIGDVAPDFTLSDTNGENPVTLSDFRGKKPVALVFGSFT